MHLRSLLTAEIALPALDLLLSATAMLPVNLAREVERRYGAPLFEIYGSTETGQIAARRTALEDEWQLWDGVQLQQIEDRVWAQGGHVEQATALADVVELRGARALRAARALKPTWSISPASAVRSPT